MADDYDRPFTLVPTLPRGNPYGATRKHSMHSHAGAWERGGKITIADKSPATPTALHNPSRWNTASVPLHPRTRV